MINVIIYVLNIIVLDLHKHFIFLTILLFMKYEMSRILTYLDYTALSVPLTFKSDAQIEI